MSEPFMALALGKQNAIADWRSLIGPTHVYKAQWERPDTLRARFGISGELCYPFILSGCWHTKYNGSNADTRNAFHGSDSRSTARKELNMVFEGIITP